MKAPPLHLPSSTPPPNHRRSFPPAAWPLAALLAWVLPGLGHWVIGERRRGMIIGGTLMALFLGGMLVGGLDVIDYRRDTIWFVGQGLFGPIALGANALHVTLDPAPVPDREFPNKLAYPTPMSPDARTGQGPSYYPSIGRVNELGTLYCTLAGVLNLLAILDVVGRLTHIPSEDELPTTGGRDAMPHLRGGGQ